VLLLRRTADMTDSDLVGEYKFVTVCTLCRGAYSRVTDSALAIGPPTVDVKRRDHIFAVHVERGKLQCFYAT
jgi:hypothetical protein